LVCEETTLSVGRSLYSSAILTGDLHRGQNFGNLEFALTG